MAHPVATRVSTTTYEDFAAEVGQLFERPINPIQAEYGFCSHKQGPNEMVSEYLTALCTLYIDCEHLDQESQSRHAARTRVLVVPPQ